MSKPKDNCLYKNDNNNILLTAENEKDNRNRSFILNNEYILKDKIKNIIKEKDNNNVIKSKRK